VVVLIDSRGTPLAMLMLRISCLREHGFNLGKDKSLNPNYGGRWTKELLKRKISAKRITWEKLDFCALIPDNATAINTLLAWSSLGTRRNFW